MSEHWRGSAWGAGCGRCKTMLQSQSDIDVFLRILGFFFFFGGISLYGDTESLENNQTLKPGTLAVCTRGKKKKTWLQGQLPVIFVGIGTDQEVLRLKHRWNVKLADWETGLYEASKKHHTVSRLHTACPVLRQKWHLWWSNQSRRCIGKWLEDVCPSFSFFLTSFNCRALVLMCCQIRFVFMSVHILKPSYFHSVKLQTPSPNAPALHYPTLQLYTATFPEVGPMRLFIDIYLYYQSAKHKFLQTF